MASPSVPTKGNEADGMSNSDSDQKITYPTGNLPKMNTESIPLLSLKRKPELSRPSSFFFISNRFESLNYKIIHNQLEIAKEKSKTFGTDVKEDLLRVCYYLLAGIFVALIGIFVDIGVLVLGRLKYSVLGKFVAKNYQGSIDEVVLMVFCWMMGVIIPVMIGSGIVILIAPWAAGGGVAQCVGYLNGVRVPKVLSIRGLVVKAVSTICTVISGIAGGKEGPMMHMGATAAAALPSIGNWLEGKNDKERRDLAACGFGAGIAVAFGSPIGGLLLALEEGVSFWNVSLMWRSFLGIIMGYIIATALLSVFEGVPGSLNNPELLAFGKITEDARYYEPFELIIFAVEGLIGGLLGAAIIKIHVYMTLFRKRYVNTNVRKLAESLIVATYTGAVTLIVVLFHRSCSSTEGLSHDHIDEINRHVFQMYCSEGQYSDMSLTYFQAQGGIIHSMFRRDPIQIMSLLIFCVIYFTLIFMTMGLSISAGLFVPQIVFGAVWGRMFGQILLHVFPNADWVKPEKYAYIGATAQLSGVVGKTFSIMVLMMEASGSVSFIIPLAVTVTVTKYVVTFFVMPVYETQMHMMGLPFLPFEPPPQSVSISTFSVMSSAPLVSLPLVPTVQTILSTLKSNQHNGFPIITKGVSKTESQIGLIIRQQLLVLLKFKAYKYPPPQTMKQMLQCRNLYLTWARKNIKLEEIQVNAKHYQTGLDLSPYYTPYPFTINETMPLYNAYSLFRNLGLRHLIIVGDNNEVIGMITRKDLAKYHTWESLGRMGITEMTIRP